MSPGTSGPHSGTTPRGKWSSPLLGPREPNLPQPLGSPLSQLPAPRAPRAQRGGLLTQSCADPAELSPVLWEHPPQSQASALAQRSALCSLLPRQERPSPSGRHACRGHPPHFWLRHRCSPRHAVFRSLAVYFLSCPREHELQKAEHLAAHSCVLASQTALLTELSNMQAPPWRAWKAPTKPFPTSSRAIPHSPRTPAQGFSPDSPSALSAWDPPSPQACVQPSWPSPGQGVGCGPLEDGEEHGNHPLQPQLPFP